MDYSLNEIESISKRAVFGAGYPWGIAEDAGIATRWLCKHSLNGCEVLANLLDAKLVISLPEHTPEIEGLDWSGNENLCPLVTGSILSDFASHLLKGAISLTKVQSALLLVPFTHLVSIQLGKCISLTNLVTEDVLVTLDAGSVELFKEIQEGALDLKVCVGGKISNPVPISNRVKPNPSSMAILERYAGLTYAPATEESRNQGAGAGLTDND